MQEIIPGSQTRPSDLPEERRTLLQRFAHNDRFFFGRIRFLSSDSRTVLGELRSFPRSDKQTQREDTQRFLKLAQGIIDTQHDATGRDRAAPAKSDAFRISPLRRNLGARLRGGRGPIIAPIRLGRLQGPHVGDKAPDFKLKYLQSPGTFQLSSNFDKRATVLIFHSFT